MIIPINNLGQVGLTPDVPFMEQALNAWTRGENVRFKDGAVEKFSGHSEVYASATIAPYWLLNPTGFWLYGGLTKVGATDGTSHADISRAAGGAYGGNTIDTWTGTILNGIPVIHNSVDTPQMWNTPALATTLTALTAWPANTTAKAMRSLKRYLVAVNVTKVGTNYGSMVKWSAAAPSNNVPTSWDETDATIDAGEWVLSSDGGVLQDMIPLREDGMLYKLEQTHRMAYVGGIDVFDFTKVFGTIGAVSARSAVEFFSGKHLLFTGDDLVLHDGQQAQSVLDMRAKRLLAQKVDTTNFQKSFVAVNYQAREVWACFVEVGQTFCSKALVWNWLNNSVTLRDLPLISFAQAGIVALSGQAWSSTSETWDTKMGSWSDGQSTPNERRLLMAVPGSTKFFQADVTQQYNASNFTSVIERIAIGFPLKVATPPDFTTEKLVRGIWPHITGTQGGVVNVYVGSQDKSDGDVDWGPAFPFTIGTSDFLDPMVTSRLHAIKFESTTNITWRLSGYDVDVVAVGGR